VKIGIIGCGYVADHYLKTLGSHPGLELLGVTDIKPERAAAVAEHYGTRVYRSNDELLADPAIEIVVNLTPPKMHFEIVKASLMAGKHVYSEKPLTVDLDEAEELVDLAARSGLLLSGAPCNILSDSAQTMWKAIRDGGIGRPQLVYAEFDDNPIYLMNPEGWSSVTGAPWPYANEYEEGCTLEHAGYHLVWLVSIFGPVQSMTAFSSCLVPDKTALPLDPPDTPDFSVACLRFQSGVVARLTCSIVAPLNHRVTVIGNEGLVWTDTYRHYQSPVYLERFTKLSLNARKARSVRASPVLQALFGVGGRRQKLVHEPRVSLGARTRELITSRPPLLGAALRWLRTRELGLQDKCLGIAEMVEALEGRRSCLLPPECLLHVTELTLALSAAGDSKEAYVPRTTFEPIGPRQSTLDSPIEYGARARGSLVSRAIDRGIARMHRH